VRRAPPSLDALMKGTLHGPLRTFPSACFESPQLRAAGAPIPQRERENFSRGFINQGKSQPTFQLPIPGFLLPPGCFSFFFFLILPLRRWTEWGPSSSGDLLSSSNGEPPKDSNATFLSISPPFSVTPLKQVSRRRFHSTF